jgi:drug/metabolite transporter (DMT)-like permease
VIGHYSGMTTTAQRPAPFSKSEPSAGSLIPFAAAILSVCLWASAFVGIRSAGVVFSPGSLALGRLLIGSLVLGVFSLNRPLSKPSKRDIVLLAVAGLLWFGLYNVALNEAEQRVDAGTAAMLVNVGPLLIVLIAALFLHERFTKALVIGGIVAFSGVLLIGLASSTGRAPLGGVLLCLVAASGYAAAVVAQKPVLVRLPALQVTWMCCVVGAVSCLPFAPSLMRELPEAAPSAIAWLVYLGVFPTALAFTAWAYALARTTAGRIAATTYLAPPIAVALSWLILHEAPAALSVPGGILCLVGVYIARRGPRSQGRHSRVRSTA